MGDAQVLSSPPTVQVRSKAGRFDQVSIALHWVTVLLVLGQLTTAYFVVQGGDNAESLLLVHRSLGTATWCVVVARLVWRTRFAQLPPFPASMPRIQRGVAKANEYSLYGLLLLQPATGMGDSLARGRPFPFFFWKAPALMAPHRAAAHLFHAMHELGAMMLLALIGLHAGAALFHLLIRRDGVLQRMLPWTPFP